MSENAATNNVWMCGDCNTPYDSMDALELHVQQDHTELSPSQSLALIRKANQDNVNADKKTHRQKFKRKVHCYSFIVSFYEVHCDIMANAISNPVPIIGFV